MLIHIIYQFIAACSSVISSNFIEAHYLVQCLPFAYHLHNHCGGAGAAKIKKKKLKICQTILQCQIRQVIDANTNSNNKRDAIASKSRCSYKVPNMASTHRSVCVCGAFFSSSFPNSVFHSLFSVWFTFGVFSRQSIFNKFEYQRIVCIVRYLSVCASLRTDSHNNTHCTLNCLKQSRVYFNNISAILRNIMAQLRPNKCDKPKAQHRTIYSNQLKRVRVWSKERDIEREKTPKW